jgi:isopentenyldiphosphate isomerase
MRVAILWLINENQEILLSQRAVNISTDASMWGPSVSGVIDDGETELQAAIREANEELGIAPTVLKSPVKLHTARHNHQDGHEREFHIFYANVPSHIHNEFILEPAEVAATRWVTLNTLKEEYRSKPDGIIIASNKELWAEIFTYLDSIIVNK